MIDNNLIKLQHFFEVDLRIKKEMYNMVPPSDNQFTDKESMCNYTDRLNDSLSYIFSELKCISLDVFGEDSIVLKKICVFEKEVYKNFYSCGLDIDKLRLFYKNYISNMNIEFIDSIKKEFIGYTPKDTGIVENVSSINEALHFIHSYIINDEQLLGSIPVINQKDLESSYSVFLRGKSTELFDKIFELFPTSLDCGQTEMVVLNNKKMIMMVRDRGHAWVNEITIKNNKARIEYFIPKICNIDMVNNLPGVHKVNENSIGTTGAFEIDVEDLPTVLFDFISKVPTDDDMIYRKM